MGIVKKLGVFSFGAEDGCFLSGGRLTLELALDLPCGRAVLGVLVLRGAGILLNISQ